MIIVKPYATLVTPRTREEGIQLLQVCEIAGRVSHRSEDTQTPESWEKFIPNVVMNHGDFSIIEHTYAQVEWLCDRGLTHEIVRHRLSAFTQESTRFVNYDKRMPASFIQPAQIDREKDPAIYKLWADAVCQAEVSYRDMVRAGIAPQIARSVLPTCTAAKLIMTCNLRMWRHFLLMRTTKEAHPQLRELTIPLLADFKARIPILFDDIEAEERQIVNMRKAR